MVTRKVWGEKKNNTVLRGLEVNALPSTGNRGAGPDDLCTGRLTEEVSKYGVSWEEPDLGERVATRTKRRKSVSNVFFFDSR